MKAFVVKNFGLEHLQCEAWPTPQPQAQQVLLRLRAASLNYRDLMMVRGEYNPNLKLPLIPGSDAVGEIVELGAGAEAYGFQVGERVCANVAQNWLSGPLERSAMRQTLGGPLPGTLAEYIAVRADSLVRAPQHLSHAEAASLPCAALTAWNALLYRGALEPGQILLTQGSGGVSLFALQFARLLGARVIVVSRSAHKLERLQQLGAHATICSAVEPAWGKRARILSAGIGVDQVIELGGSDTLAESLVALKPEGKISIIGVLSGKLASVPLTPILMQNLRIFGVFVGHRQSFEAMLSAIALHKLTPTIDRVFPFAETPQAFAHLASGAHFGKICIQIDA